MFQSALRQRFEDDKANKKAEDIFSFYKNFAFSPTFSSTNTKNKEPGADQNRYRQEELISKFRPELLQSAEPLALRRRCLMLQ
jgi:hypothetical protein